MYKTALTVFAFVLGFTTVAQSQNLSQATWQQRVDYNIQVTLRDSQNVLSGFETMTYYNNSPDTLKEIYIHLWPNAYLNTETPFAKQQIENGKTDFYHAPKTDRGKLDSLNFRVDGQRVKTEFVVGYEVAKLILDNPVLAGQKVEISTPFRVKMPKVFSRLGEENMLYCVTQWYPKPAVYDVNGWNPMPYLDQGEFYSEYGKFVVDITVPKDYVVAATGQIQQLEEKEWWLKRNDVVFEKHPSNQPLKTLRFVQDSVHDFAWFASAKFKVSKGEVKLNNGRTVETWFFSEKDNDKKREEGILYTNDAVKFYSDNVGNYPYQHASVVITKLKAGGGMEYPTITNVTEVNRQVVVHEVGHNWFYGILGNNERRYPWMDESINNYYESRSTYTSKPVKHRNLFGGKKSGGFSIGTDNLAESSFGVLDLQYLYTARSNNAQAPFLTSEEFTNQNYGTIIYGKAALAFLQLEVYLGKEIFDGMMKSYYEKWKFKHPLPDDFINHAKTYTGKNLDWFFNGLMNNKNNPDHAICGIKKRNGNLAVTLKNKGGVATPFVVQTMNGDSILHETKVEPFTGKTTITLPVANATHVKIDAREESIDVFRDNNYARASGLFKTARKIEVKMLVNKEKPYNQQLYWMPIIGANYYNKTMLGLAFYNSILPRKKTEYIIAPMYAFGTKDVAGYVSLQRRILGNGFIKEAQIGVDVARFATAGYNSNQIIGSDTLGNNILGEEYGIRVYEKLTPRISFIFANNTPRNGVEKRLDIRYVMVNEQKHTTALFSNFDQHMGYADVKYTYKKRSKLKPYDVQLNYQYANAQSVFQKITAEY
ncbi:MAG: M1 family metallopeptidase, partial [Bacteroidia bacterium]